MDYNTIGSTVGIGTGIIGVVYAIYMTFRHFHIVSKCCKREAFEFNIDLTPNVKEQEGDRINYLLPVNASSDAFQHK